MVVDNTLEAVLQVRPMTAINRDLLDSQIDILRHQMLLQSHKAANKQINSCSYQ